MPSGYALEFDGINDYVKVDNDASLTFDISGGIEIVADIKTNDISGGDTFSDDNPRYIIAKMAGSASTINYALRVLGGRLQFIARDSTNSHYIICAMEDHDIEVGVWYAVKLVHTGTQIKLYINGEEKKSVNNSDANLQSTADIFIGQEGTGYVRRFDGIIADLKITHNTNVEANWPMNEGIGSIIYDRSTNTNNGTIYGASWVSRR